MVSSSDWFLKINVDGAVKGKCSLASIGGIL